MSTWSGDENEIIILIPIIDDNTLVLQLLYHSEATFSEIYKMVSLS
jgi:hypothetical protein